MARPKGGVSFHNTGNVLRAMRQRKARVTAELSRAAVELKPVLVAESKAVLNEKIYSVEIPFKKRVDEKTKKKYAGTSTQRAGGKDLRQWKRAANQGGILGAETGRTEGPVVILLNSKKYAAARWKLGTPAGRKIKTPGVQSVQWHQEALRRQRPRIVAVRRKAVLRALRARG